MFLTRCKDTTKKNSLYYTSRIVRDIVMSNEEHIKIINTGTFQMVEHTWLPNLFPKVVGCMVTLYSYYQNNSTGHYKRTGYLIGFFGYNIKNYCLFNNFFWKFRQKNKRTCAIIRGIRVGLDCISDHVNTTTSFFWSRAISHLKCI